MKKHSRVRRIVGVLVAGLLLALLALAALGALSNRDLLPPVVESVVPYRLVLPLFIGGTDGYISLVLHEAFHAYQGTVAPATLTSAEEVTALEAEYGGHEADMRAAWRDELSLLATAAASGARDDPASHARRFLAHRTARRAAVRLAPNLVDYERKREWLEGLAKYVELEAWRTASVTGRYRPRPSVTRDPDFQAYSTFPAKWSRELGQMKRMASAETRFYYSGLAQAVLLDRVMPGWKDGALTDGVWLEDLIAESLADATGASADCSPEPR